jgi:hypothetical protein
MNQTITAVAVVAQSMRGRLGLRFIGTASPSGKSGGIAATNRSRSSGDNPPASDTRNSLLMFSIAVISSRQSAHRPRWNRIARRAPSGSSPSR